MTILPTAYLPAASYFCTDLLHGDYRIEVAETYPKQTFRNRCLIRDTHGRVVRLTVPVCKTEQPQRTGDVRISYQTKWQHEHWNAILSYYGHRPYFLYYADYIRPFYERQYDCLCRFNHELTETLCSLLRNTPPAALPPFRGTDHWSGLQWNKDDKGLNALSILDILFEYGPETLLYLDKR
ncbi:MAG: WbqC family protein [Paludibacteraceae bacterium]|nr:WbqC family protein [Paludibacteraceae bacterium]MBR1481064.1 WbqC family protein [Paludibacteraceae bacterium]